MDSSVIYNAIYQYFRNYEYKLFNTFLYEWESDFFAQSKSGYRVEVEVKVSRSDFFKDFEKPKHRLFDAWLGKRKVIIDRWPADEYTDSQFRYVGSYITKIISFRYKEERGFYGEPGWAYGRKNGKWGYWVNDYGPATVKEREVKMYAPATRIKIRMLTDILCPNQFYYACPKGMIRLNELPSYAGLIYVDDTVPFGQVDLVKKAPYLHKHHQDLTKQLLKKYYNLWEYKVSRQSKMEMLEELNNQTK